MTDIETAGVISRVISEVWGRGDLDLADQLFAPGYINHGGLIPDAIRGPESIKLAVALYRKAFPGLRITIDHLAHEGEQLTFSWKARSNSSHDRAPGAERTSQGFIAGMMSVRVVRGRITRVGSLGMPNQKCDDSLLRGSDYRAVTYLEGERPTP